MVRESIAMNRPANQLAIRHQAEQAAAALPPLLVAADRVASTVVQGVHGRRRVGLGDTFWQFRRYEPGDSMRSIDWRQSAKREHIYVRETEWAAAQSVWLWLDRSSSMAYCSHKSLPRKGDRAALMLLAVASLLVGAGERVALLGGGLRPVSGRSALDRLTMQILVDPGSANGDADGLPALEPLPRHAELVLIGDFLSPLEEIDGILRRYAARGVKGHMLQILDPAERALPFKGRTRFEGMENEGRVLIKRVENVRRDYKVRMEDHLAGLSALARSNGWTFDTHRTDVAPERALLTLYMAMSELAR